MELNNLADLKRIQELAGFKPKGGDNINESNNSTPVVEYQTKGADGRTYGIVNEGHKFYIKVAPKKDTKVMNEDFDYIGGVGNKKAYEYTSYNAASKHLDLKMQSLREAYEPSQEIALPSAGTAEWQTDVTREVRESINRFHQISNNVDYILAEDKNSVKANMETPEAPDCDPDDETKNQPFTNSGEATLDKDPQFGNIDAVNAGAPFTDDISGEADELMVDIKAASKHAPNCTSQPFCISAKKHGYAPDNAIATEYKNPTNPVRADESRRRTIRITEAQANNCFDSETDELDEMEIGFHDAAGFDGYDDYFDEMEPEYEIEGDEIFDLDGTFEDTPIEIELDDDEPSEDTNDLGDVAFAGNGKAKKSGKANKSGKVKKSDKLGESKTNMWGDHPGYRKQPMKISGQHRDPRNTHSWDDSSVASEEPFGSTLGNGAPFNEKLVNILTDAVTHSIQEMLSKKGPKA